jgi:hypothetical protein
MQQEAIDRAQLMATLRSAQKCEAEDDDAHASMSQAPKNVNKFDDFRNPRDI